VEATFGKVVIRPLGSVVESNIVSDDFNRCSYDNGLWYWENPLVDSSITVQNGYTDEASLAMTVPQGQNHIINVNTNSAPKIIQPINDGDFQIEVKIDSLFSPIGADAYPLNGIVVADNDHSKWIQVETRAKLDGLYLVVISYENLGSSWLTIPWLNTKISEDSISPIRLSVLRYGSRYLVGYQLADQPWVQRLTFPLHQAVTQTYVYTGNYGGSQAPAHTTLIDYFLNTSNPFSVEDGERNEIIAQLVGEGSVTKNPDLISYTCGQSVELIANPGTGYSFTEWQGDLAGSDNPAIVNMNGPKSITALFTIQSYQLDVTKDGTGIGTITSSPAGIDCGETCEEDSASFDYGTTVTLTAGASIGSTFTGWSGGGCSGTGICIVILDEAKTVTATFSTSNILSVVKTGSGGGTVTSVPEGIDCGETCSASFENGTTVTLTAVASAGSTFNGWTGVDCAGTGTCTVTVDTEKSVFASFEEELYIIEIDSIGEGRVDIDPQKTYYAYSEVVTITATPNSGWFFEQWDGSEFGNNNPLEIFINKDYSLTAVFSQRRVYLPLIIK
jgi:hypothetical protein